MTLLIFLITRQQNNVHVYAKNRAKKFHCIFHVSLNLADAEYIDTSSLKMSQLNSR